MQIKNLWGEIDTEVKLPDPLRLMQGQAALVEGLTGGALVGRVRRRVISPDVNGTFRITLGIIAPYLENFSLEIVDATYPPTVYPVTLINLISMDKYACETEDEFMDKLGEILRSDRVQSYISSLVAHSFQEREYDHPRRALIS